MSKSLISISSSLASSYRSSGPKLGWKLQDEYTSKLKNLAIMFNNNFKKYNLDELSKFGPCV